MCDSIFEKSEIKPKTLHVLGHNVSEQVRNPSSGLLYKPSPVLKSQVGSATDPGHC